MTAQHGLRIRRNGKVTLDSSKGIPRRLGGFVTESNGQLVDNRFASGRAWVFAVPLTDITTPSLPLSAVVSGNTLTWSGIQVLTRIMYGVF